MLGKRIRAALVAVGTAAGLLAAVPAAAAAPPPSHAIAWGEGAFGQLGNGGNGGSQIPVQVRRPELRFTEVAGSFSHSLAITADGTVWAWGQNNLGQLGDGTHNDTNEPVKVTGLTDIVEVAAGWGFSLARSSTGRVWAWGTNDVGQLGLGFFGGSVSTPQPWQERSGITRIDAGWFHGLAIQNGFAVLAWGANSRGQLGDGTGIEKASPVQLGGSLGGGELGFVYDVAAGFHHSLAIRTDGTMFAWGANNWGQLGTGTTSVTPSLSPKLVVGRFRDVRGLAAGCRNSYLADPQGRAWGWGDNSQAQVAATGSVVTQPQIISGLSGVADVAAGCQFALALTNNEKAFAWGANNAGQLGTGVPVPFPPRQVVGGDGILYIAAGGDHGLAAQRISNPG